MTLPRLLDLAAVAAAAWLGGALLFWSGWSASFWMRPEHVALFLVGIVTARLLIAPVAVPKLDPRRTLVVGVAAYALIFSFVTVTRHLAFRTHALDLGYYVQLTWNLARSHGPRVSLPDMHAWGDHFSPIMYLFVPAFWVAPGPVVLLVGQSLALAAGAVAVFGIASRRLAEEPAAVAFAILYLLNPSLHGINIRDFHAAALAIPLLLAALCFAEGRRPALFVACVVLTLMCREDAALPVMGLGIWLALGRRRWLAGAAIAGGALAVLAIDLRVVIPHFRGEPYTHLWRYSALGHSLGEIAGTVLLKPLRTLNVLLTGGRLLYLVLMLVPLGFLPLYGAWDLVGALPALAENLLSSDPVLYNHRTQYQAFVLPFLVLAAVGGYGRLMARGRGRIAAAFLAIAFALSLALASPAMNDLAVARWWPDAEQRAAYAVLARIPPAASVAAQDRYVAHLSLRSLVTVFPVELDRVDYVVLNERTYPWRNLPGVTFTRVGDAVTIVADQREFRYTVAAQAGPHLLLRKL
ncbi:MAG TPA: DUF2079 domain-containing protein [Candidatus Methylomirabilis sp.]|nr:DUF2079 domain-containing protein [Candidatus Methylomirabilis sp.]